jgi:type III pantothenate kinase
VKLLVDVGNNRLKWAWLDRGELRHAGSVAHGGRFPEGAISGTDKLHGHPSEILVASVAAPALSTEIAEGLTREFAAPVRVAQPEAAALGVKNGYAEPRQLGVDRWLAMLAAFARWRQAICLVDAGTALTVDAVAADGNHLGGVMVPGQGLMREALLRATGGIGAATRLAVGASAGRDWWGRDTENCIRLGSLRAVAGLIESCMNALTIAGEARGILVVTGGDAPALLAHLSLAAEHRPLLVLEGLALRHGGRSE